MSDDITSKDVVILIMYVIKDKYPQIFLEETLVSQNWWEVVKVSDNLVESNRS